MTYDDSAGRDPEFPYDPLVREWLSTDLYTTRPVERPLDGRTSASK